MNLAEKKFLDFVLGNENYGYLKFGNIDMINQKEYCEHGHPVLGGTCSQCAQRMASAAEVEAAPAVAPSTPNRTLVQLRELKSLLQKGLITEAEYDERRNDILANF
ncbi:SHOCT domain-containing protein [Hymenobacter negativus]|uniref:SHOCT domain-containing protein n=1 Tax=Hymenobacter negativus TaxID=2795026 RepID=UPI0018DBBEEB|nr:SHOCT domain-containing protein [Hymenobacter negativus]MBH8568730.1 SHOCT domain-containing protein [Hymenobacter negativus]